MPGQKKKKNKGKAPAHQNTFAFFHNPNSRTTKKILSLPNIGVCKRCYDKIEWKKKYRKYKPRTQPGVCNKCHKRNVLAAYHTICTDCSYVNDKHGKTVHMCAMCVKEPVNNKHYKDDDDEQIKETIDAINVAIENSDKPLKLREIKTIQRNIQKKDDNHHNNDDDDDDDNDDDIDSENETNENDVGTTNDLFLEAIGGKQNFITSVEEYQQMKLVKE